MVSLTWAASHPGTLMERRATARSPLPRACASRTDWGTEGPPQGLASWGANGDSTNVDVAPAEIGRGGPCNIRTVTKGAHSGGLIQPADSLPGLSSAPGSNEGEDEGGANLRLLDKGSTPLGALLLLRIRPKGAMLNIPVQEGTGGPRNQSSARQLCQLEGYPGGGVRAKTSAHGDPTGAIGGVKEGVKEDKIPTGPNRNGPGPTGGGGGSTSSGDSHSMDIHPG